MNDLEKGIDMQMYMGVYTYVNFFIPAAARPRMLTPERIALSTTSAHLRKQLASVGRPCIHTIVEVREHQPP